MRWQMGRRSENVVDRRGGGGGAGLRVGGIGGIGVVVVALIAMFLGVDPSVVLQNLPTETESSSRGGPVASSPEEEQLKAFVATVLADTEDTWHAEFQAMGQSYEEPRLVLFNGGVSSACGYAGTAVGPFYCPGDRQVYLDLGFFDELDRRFGAPGDFAQAYVVAHEVGHHVQTLLGISDQVREAQSRLDEAGRNALSVRLELQADCLAGVWAAHADRERGLIEAGDIDEALNAASAIGDDRLQRRSQGHVVPESFTHGSSAERVRWFRAGFEAGSSRACDTFASGRG